MVCGECWPVVPGAQEPHGRRSRLADMNSTGIRLESPGWITEGFRALSGWEARVPEGVDSDPRHDADGCRSETEPSKCARLSVCRSAACRVAARQAIR